MKKLLLILSLVAGLVQNVNAEEVLASIDGNYTRVTISGNTMYVGTKEGVLQLFDVSSPVSPAKLGEVDVNSTAIYNMAVEGQYAYLVNGADHAVKVVDIGNPNAPVLLKTYETEYKDPQNEENTDSTASDGLVILGPVGSSAVTVRDNYAYVADMDYGFQIIDVSTPASPQHVTTWSTNGYAVDVVLDGNNAYVADISTGLHIIDITSPAQPSKVSDYDALEYPYLVKVSGHYAYVADQNGLNIIDVTDPAAPVQKAIYPVDDNILDIYIDGTVAYVAENSLGVELVDVENPSSPKHISQYTTQKSTTTLAISQGYLYVTTGTATEDETGRLVVFKALADMYHAAYMLPVLKMLLLD